MRKLLRTLRQLLRLDDPVTRLCGDETGVHEERAVEPEERVHTADLVLAERAEHPLARVLAVDAVDDQLRNHRVIQRGDLPTDGDARIDANPRPRRLAVARDPPRRREEAVGGILGIDPALDRVPTQLNLLL